MEEIYTTKTAADMLWVKQDTVKHYALRFGIGVQPGGPGTAWLFTKDDLLEIRRRVRKLKFAKESTNLQSYIMAETDER